MLIIGHRGAAAFEPENTILSFKKAIALNAKMIEFDVQLCKSGEVVVIHDYTLERTTNGSGFVIDKTIKQLKKLDAGKGEKIPTLEETLITIDKKAKVNIELKGISSANQTANIIKFFIENEKWSIDDFLVSSFHHSQLNEIKNLIPKLQIAPLFEDIPSNFLDIAKQLKAYSINADYRFFTKENIEIIHLNGFKAFAYTVNSERDKKNMELLGIDGIFTDCP